MRLHTRTSNSRRLVHRAALSVLLTVAATSVASAQEATDGVASASASEAPAVASQANPAAASEPAQTVATPAAQATPAADSTPAAVASQASPAAASEPAPTVATPAAQATPAADSSPLPATGGAGDKPKSLAAQLQELEAGLSAFKKENALLQGRIATLETKVATLEGRKSKIGFGLSLGLSVPVRGHDRVLGMVSGHIKWLSGYYYAGKGGGLSISFMELEFGQRVRVRPLGLGAIYYLDAAETFSEGWALRSLDIVLPIGFDVRVWKGLSVGTQASWFLPPIFEFAQPFVGFGLRDENQPAKEVLECWLGALATPRIEVFSKWSF